jgi:hypothetical protein
VSKAVGLSLLLILLLALIGAAAGYFTAPRYRAPANSGEERLRARAEAYYRALQVKDATTIVTSYTPARQLKEREELRQRARHEEQMFSRFEPATQDKLRESSLTIRADELEVQLEGDWAVTNGNITVHPIETEPERMAQIPIGEVVWLRTGGDWWIYEWRMSEIQAYGNPPDFALKLLKKQSQGLGNAGTIELEALPEAEGGEQVDDAAEDGATADDSQDEGAGDA